MSWSISVKVPIPPNESGQWLFQNAVTEAAVKERVKVQEQPNTTDHQRQRMLDQISTAEFVSRMIFERSVTTYQTGCTAYATLSGHSPDDLLNFGPHHVNISVSITPVPHKR